MRFLNRYLLTITVFTLAACTASPIFAQSQNSLIALVRMKLDSVTASATAIQAVLPASTTTSLTPAQDSVLALVRTDLNAITTGAAAIRAMLPMPSIVTTPTPSPTPTPASTPVPTPTSSAYTSVVGDNFTGYKNTAALLANITNGAGGTGTSQTALYNDGANATLASIDTTVKYAGHQTLKYTQPGGVANTPELWVNFKNGNTLSILWYRVKLRFSPGWTDTGTLTNSANAYKLLGFGWDTYDGSSRLEITNTSQYQIGWTTQAKDGSGVNGGGDPITVLGNITTEWTDGAWNDYIIRADFSKSPATIAVWMAKDGQTPVLKGTYSGTMKPGLPLPHLTGVMLGLNFNQVRAAGQTQALWYGQWEVIDGSKYTNPFQLPGYH
ncbi:MAG TPA: hypothetical protein VNU46_05075 [Gemmatimonadaceae bacterium]|jgi:hypothetical protein|nr:hypothetical protein [Gemmatimonadaceae bacterium]